MSDSCSLSLSLPSPKTFQKKFCIYPFTRGQIHGWQSLTSCSTSHVFCISKTQVLKQFCHSRSGSRTQATCKGLGIPGQKFLIIQWKRKWRQEVKHAAIKSCLDESKVSEDRKAFAGPHVHSLECSEEMAVPRNSGGQENLWKTKKKSSEITGCRTDIKASQKPRLKWEDLREDLANSGVVVHHHNYGLHGRVMEVNLSCIFTAK